MSQTTAFVLLLIGGFVTTFGSLALGLGLVFMVFAHRRDFAKRLVVVSAIVVTLGLALFIAMIPHLET